MTHSKPSIENRLSFYAIAVLLALLGAAEAARFVFALPIDATVSVALFAAAASGLFLLVRGRALVSARIGAIVERETERRRLAQSDALTGALSRSAFFEALRAATRPGATDAARLLLIDVDHFKAINDSFGHAAGDAVLRRLVTVAVSRFPDGAVGRLGGDEFAVLLVGRDAQEAMEAAAAFLAELRQPAAIGGHVTSIGCSIGMAAAPQDAAFVDELILSADLALYESKRRGRGCVTPFHRSMLTDRQYRRFVERELRAAILLNELELHYQPVQDACAAMQGVEALVRWRHPLRGTISPAEFVPIAEQSTLIDLLGEWVLARAASDAARLPAGSIAVNVSGAQLRHDLFIEATRRILKDTGCPPGRLVFEITEGVAVAATPAVLARIEAIRALGIRIALDDFGTGNCGFHALRSLPVDAIKIDRSYIQAMAGDEIAAVVVSALAAIGRARSIAIVAEGVETQAQLALARAAGCTRFQGYFLGRPMPLGELPAEATAALRRTG